MKKTLLVILVLTLGLGSPLATRAGRPNQAVPVTSTIDGTGSLPDPTIQNYRIQSELLGPYHDGVDSVVSQMQGNGGDYELNTLGSLTRKMLIDLRDTVPNSGATPPFGVQQIPARIVTKTYELYPEKRPYNMTGLGSTLLSPIVLRFDLNGNTWRLWMNSQLYPETNYAVITCTGVVDPNNPSTSQCNQWRIEPSVTQPDGQRKNITKLVRAYTAKGKTIEENHGDFYMSFSLKMTNP